MYTIVKAFSEDFEKVYPLLASFPGSSISKEDWRKLFSTSWVVSEALRGYLLLEDSEVKGYLGLIFSERLLNGKTEKFCNMTSWIVNEECRGQSVLMLLEMLKLKDYTLTNFTASPTVAALLSKLGFKEFAVDQRVLLPVPRITPSKDRVGYDVSPKVIRSKLADEDLRIFDDHQGLNCQHLLLRSSRGDCYLILKKTRRKKLTFAKVHYLSNIEVFHECMNELADRICLRLRVFGIMVDERYIGGRQFRGSLPYPQQRKAYFRSNTNVNKNSIDTIYSELVVLHN
jgi:hypothetical protein